MIAAAADDDVMMMMTVEDCNSDYDGYGNGNDNKTKRE